MVIKIILFAHWGNTSTVWTHKIACSVPKMCYKTVQVQLIREWNKEVSVLICLAFSELLSYDYSRPSQLWLHHDPCWENIDTGIFKSFCQHIIWLLQDTEVIYSTARKTQLQFMCAVLLSNLLFLHVWKHLTFHLWPPRLPRSAHGEQ